MNIRKWFAAALCTVTLLVFNLACASKPNQSATSAADNTPPLNHIKHIIYIIQENRTYCKKENPRLCRGGSRSLTVPGVRLSTLL